MENIEDDTEFETVADAYDALVDKEHDLSIMDLLGVDSETYEQLRQWLANCEQSGEPMSYEL